MLLLVQTANLVGRLEAGVRDLRDRKLFVVSLLCGDNWSIGNEREVDPWVGNQVGLELSQINIKSTIESERGGNGRYNLTNQSEEKILLTESLKNVS